MARKKSVGVVGGGWYGCHIAATLQAAGFQVTLFERRHRLLHEASGLNQNRLHMGFHYARHSDTRLQSRDGFLRFIQQYPHLSKPVKHNIYAVPVDDSLLDFVTYRTIMAASWLSFNEDAAPDTADVRRVGRTVLYTPERVILPSLARSHFSTLLGGSVILGRNVSSIQATVDEVWIDDERFDYAIDASWGHASNAQGLTTPIFFEPTLLLYYRGPPDFAALTLVDGPLCSIYPTEDVGVYTLSSVPHTPLGQFDTAWEAEAVVKSVDERLIASKRLLMEDQIQRYVPSFTRLFEYVGPQLAIKTKHVYGAHDGRSCSVTKRGRTISIMSGKIDGIFTAADLVLDMVKADVHDLSHNGTFGLG